MSNASRRYRISPPWPVPFIATTKLLKDSEPLLLELLTRHYAQVASLPSIRSVAFWPRPLDIPGRFIRRVIDRTYRVEAWLWYDVFGRPMEDPADWDWWPRWMLWGRSTTALHRFLFGASSPLYRLKTVTVTEDE